MDTLTVDELMRGGDRDFQQSNYAAAARQYEEALARYSERFDAANPLTAEAATRLARAAAELDDHPRAVRAYELALALYGQLAGNWQRATAAVYNDLGSTHQRAGALDRALEYYQRALALQRRAARDRPEPPLLRATGLTYANLGTLYSARSDFDQALIYLRAGLEAFADGEAPLHRGRLYLHIGRTYERMGDYDQALLYHEKALRLLRAHLPAGHVYLAAAYGRIGVCLEHEGYPVRAEANYRRSLRIYRSRLGDRHPRVAEAYSHLGNTYRQRDDYTRALDYHQRALDLRRAHHRRSGGEHVSLAESYRELGSTYQALRDYPTARDYFARAGRIYAAVYRSTSAPYADVQLRTAQTFHAQVRPDSTLFYLARALESLDYTPGLPDPFVQVRSLPALLEVLVLQSEAYLARFRQTGYLADLEGATRSAEQGTDLVDYTKLRHAARGHQPAFQQQALRLCQTGIEIARTRAVRYTDPTELETAFTYAERSNNALLSDALRETEARRFAGIPDSLLARERSLQADIIHAEQRRFEYLQGADSLSAPRMNALTDALFEQKSAYRRLIRHFESAYPDYYALKYDPKTLTVRDIQERLLAPGQTLVEYFESERALYAFVVRPDSFFLIPLGPPAPVRAQLDLLTRSLREYPRHYADPYEADALYVNAAHTLYRQLVAPLEAHLSKDLLIVPGGRLGYVPFDALLRARPHRYADFRTHDYLLRHYRISYAYSATLHGRMQHRTPSRAAGPFLGVAPAFTDAPLRHNTTEVERLKRTLGGQTLTGGTATLAQFIARAGDSRVLHLATHGKANDQRGEYSYIAFAADTTGTTADRLYVSELYNLPLDADLVVLSACESGTGEWQPGEGIISMTRGFAYAGARSVLTTLWLVDDKTSLRLMSRFYAELARGLPKHQALRRARLHYLDRQPHHRAHPYFWAAYTPVGNMAPLSPGPAAPGYPYPVLALLACCVVLIPVVAFRLLRVRPRAGSFG